MGLGKTIYKGRRAYGNYSNKKRKWKQKVSQRRIALKEKMLLENIQDTDVKVSLITGTYSEGLKAVNEKLQEEKSGVWREKAHKHGKGKTMRAGQARQLGISYGPEYTDRSAARVRNKLSNSEVPFGILPKKIPRAL